MDLLILAPYFFIRRHVESRYERAHRDHALSGSLSQKLSSSIAKAATRSEMSMCNFALECPDMALLLGLFQMATKQLEAHGLNRATPQSFLPPSGRVPHLAGV